MVEEDPGISVRISAAAESIGLPPHLTSANPHSSSSLCSGDVLPMFLAKYVENTVYSLHAVYL
jgi:hypothetical protein